MSPDFEGIYSRCCIRIWSMYLKFHTFVLIVVVDYCSSQVYRVGLDKYSVIKSGSYPTAYEESVN